MKLLNTLNRFVPVKAYKRINECVKIDPPQFKYDIGEFYFILDSFNRIPTNNKAIKYTKDGLLTLSSTYFRRYITKNHASCLRWLENNNIIVCDRIKKVGKSYAYNIKSDLISEVKKIELDKNSNIARRIIVDYNKRRKKNHKKLPEDFKQMKALFKKRCKIDADKALAYIENKLKEGEISINQYNRSYISINLIKDGNTYFKQNKTNNRIDSNLTNLRKDLKQFLIERDFQIDCINSQPSLINFITEFTINLNNNKGSSLGENVDNIIMNHLTQKELSYLKKAPFANEIAKAEYERFRNDTLRGDIYLKLQSEFQEYYGKNISRREMKTLIFKVFFSNNYSCLQEKEIFKRSYPIIYQIIYNIKKHKHNSLALCLQNIESHIFIGRICKQLCKEGIVPMTIHDSVIVPEEHIERTLEIMKNVYDEILNDTPTFKIEPL